MLKTSTFLIATALATLIAGSALAQSLAYVGNSGPPGFQGDGGVLAFHEACDIAFPGSQFCTSEDIVRGGVDPDAGGDDVWVHPVFVTADAFGNYKDFSGVQAVGTGMSCTGWSSNAGGLNGLALEGPKGSFALLSCGVLRKVACCRQKEDED